MSNKRDIQLSESLCAAVERRFCGNGKTLEEFLGLVLEELARDEASRLDEAEKQVIEERLRQLGYL